MPKQTLADQPRRSRRRGSSRETQTRCLRSVLPMIPAPHPRLGLLLLQPLLPYLPQSSENASLQLPPLHLRPPHRQRRLLLLQPQHCPLSSCASRCPCLRQRLHRLWRCPPLLCPRPPSSRVVTRCRTTGSLICLTCLALLLLLLPLRDQLRLLLFSFLPRHRPRFQYSCQLQLRLLRHLCQLLPLLPHPRPSHSQCPPLRRLRHHPWQSQMLVSKSSKKARRSSKPTSQFFKREPQKFARS